MDKLAGLASLAKQMPTTIGSIKTNTIPLVPKSWGGNALRIHNPFGGQKAKAIPSAPPSYSAPEASAPPANSPNAQPAQPAPEIVTVIKAANAAVNGSAKKVAALLKSNVVIAAARNLVNEITPNNSPKGRFVNPNTGKSVGTMVGGRKTRKSKGKRKSRSSRH